MENASCLNLRDQKVIAHALTHAHPDHQGGSKRVCETLNIPFWCSEPDKKAAETGALWSNQVIPTNVITRLQNILLAGPGHPVTRILQEGDMLGEFKVIATPGHSPGHISFWRESDRVLVLGDVLRNMSFKTGREKLDVPPDIFTVNPVQNRESARKIAALQPSLICFGHGRPLTDMAKLTQLVEALPR